MPAQRRDDGQATRASTPRPAAAGVCAVVVTFRPEVETLANLRAIRRQVDRLVVVDNAATPASRALLAPLADDPAVACVFNEENAGVAAALNQGWRRADEGPEAWLATFDQDSRVPDGYVAGLLAGLARYPEREHVAVVAPLYRDRNLGFVSSAAGPVTGAGEAAVSVAATSGNLVARRALADAGGFREDFFIDCVDFEFCLRCRRRGWRILEVRDVVLEHAQGRWERRRWLGRVVRVNDYDATRRYYQARNRLVLHARFAAFDPRWCLRDAWGYGCDLAKLVLLGAGRRAKLAAILTGWAHAFAGRRGPR